MFNPQPSISKQLQIKKTVVRAKLEMDACILNFGDMVPLQAEPFYFRSAACRPSLSS